MAITVSTAEEFDSDAMWHWWLHPSWGSIFRWPLGLYCLAGFAYSVVFTLALQWDLIRWNLLLYLLFGWNVPLIVSMLPAYFVYLFMILTYGLWHINRLRRWWWLPVKAAATCVMAIIAEALFGIILIMLYSLLNNSLRINLSTVEHVIFFFSKLGLWTILLP